MAQYKGSAPVAPEGMPPGADWCRTTVGTWFSLVSPRSVLDAPDHAPALSRCSPLPGLCEGGIRVDASPPSPTVPRRLTVASARDRQVEPYRSGVEWCRSGVGPHLRAEATPRGTRGTQGTHVDSKHTQGHPMGPKGRWSNPVASTARPSAAGPRRLTASPRASRLVWGGGCLNLEALRGPPLVSVARVAIAPF
jgi:hypothetical protein